MPERKSSNGVLSPPMFCLLAGVGLRASVGSTDALLPIDPGLFQSPSWGPQDEACDFSIINILNIRTCGFFKLEQSDRRPVRGWTSRGRIRVQDSSQQILAREKNPFFFIGRV